MINPPSGLIEQTDYYTRNPAAKINISWGSTLISGEWFVIDESLVDSNSLITKITYPDGADIEEFISDIDAYVFSDESEYIQMIEGYSELLGDSFQYSSSDMDCELDNSNNRFTPRKNKNKLANPGFEDNKDFWNEYIGGSELVDQEQLTSSSNILNIGGINTPIGGQSFIPLKNNISKIALRITRRYTSNTSPLKIQIRTSMLVSGNKVPSNTILASVVYPASYFNSSSSDAVIDIVCPVTPGQTHFITVEQVNPSNTYYYRVYGATPQNYTGGNFVLWNITSNAWIQYGTMDMYFKTYYQETKENRGNFFINEFNVRKGRRSLQINNSGSWNAYLFSDIVPIYNIDSKYKNPITSPENWTFSAYMNGTGKHSVNLSAFTLSASGSDDFSTGYLTGSSYQTSLVSGSWTRLETTLTVPSGTNYLRAAIVASGIWSVSDDLQLEKNSYSTNIEEDFIGEKIYPKRAIKSFVGFSDYIVPKFTGLIDKIVPDIKNDTVQIHAYDWTDKLKDTLITSELYQNVRSDQLIGYLADMVGISVGRRKLEQGVDTIDFAWFQEGSAWTYMQQIAEAEGGRIFFDEEGILNFWNRNHYFNQNENPVYTFNFNDNILDLKYDISKDKIKNRIVVKAQPKQLLNKTIIYNDTNQPSLSYDNIQEFWCQFAYSSDSSVSAINVEVPTIGQNIIANTKADGTGTNVSSYLAITSHYVFSESIKINIVSTYPETIYITKFQVLGQPIVVKKNIQYVAEDYKSQRLYDVQELQIENDLIDSEEYAKLLGDQKLAELKDPRDLIQIECIGVPYLQLGDLVRVQNSFEGTYDNYFISKNRWRMDGEFVQNLDLIKFKKVLSS